jgi:hypothetical protein
MLTDFLKDLFCKSNTKISGKGVSRVTIDRAQVQRVKVERVEPKKAKVLTNSNGQKLTKLRYTDTDEIVVLDMHDMKIFEEVMTNGRPVEIMGFATEEDLA